MEKERIVNFLQSVRPLDEKHRNAVSRALQYLYQQGLLPTGSFLFNVARDTHDHKMLTPRQAEVVAKQLLRYVDKLTAMTQPQQKPLDPLLNTPGYREYTRGFDPHKEYADSLRAQAGTLAPISPEAMQLHEERKAPALAPPPFQTQKQGEVHDWPEWILQLHAAKE